MSSRFVKCLCVAVALAAAITVNAQAPATEQSRPWTEKYWTSADGTRFHYVEMGSGVPVILIHGAGGTAIGNWFLNGIGPSIAKTNRVIGIDMRNHGLTTPNPGPRGNMAQDVIDFMNAQQIQRAHIGGYSMGGFVTSQLMALAPDRFITAHFGGSGIRETPEWLDKIPEDKKGVPDMEAKASARFNAARTTPPAAGEQIGNGAGGPPRVPASAPQPAAAPRAAAAGPAGPPAGPTIDLSTIKFPVLTVIGEYDRPKATTHRMWRELSHYQVVVLPDRGHLSAIAPSFIHPNYIKALTDFVVNNNPK